MLAGHTNFAAAELAATNAQGEIYTFRQGFYDYVGNYDNALDLYQAEGAGTRVTVYADPR